MLYNAKNLTLPIGNTYMDYVCFGKGSKSLVMIPGLNPKGVKGAALPLAYMYRSFINEYRVYVFDRKADIPEGYTIENIAEDIACAMNSLGIGKADIFGASQGGMIAQYLAIRNPELVNKLVLAVTLSKENETVRKVIENWIDMAGHNDYKSIMLDSMKNMYSEAYLKKYRWLLPILSRIGRPKDPERFIRLAKACLTCNTYDKLDFIRCPVLVIGGKEDKIVTGRASEEIAEKLCCEIYMYDNLGHAAYEEAGDFNERILTFLSK